MAEESEECFVRRKASIAEKNSTQNVESGRKGKKEKEYE